MLNKSKSKGKGMKVGDKVKVVGNQGYGCWGVGHVGWILELSEDNCRVSDEGGGSTSGNWYGYEDLELVEEESYTFVDPRKQLYNTMGVDWSFDKSNSAVIVDDLLPMGNLVGDNVNHPSHYGNGSIECIDYLEDFLTKEEFIGYLRGNIGKYMHRWRYKNGLEDLRKAEWYLNKLMGVMRDET